MVTHLRIDADADVDDDGGDDEIVSILVKCAGFSNIISTK